MGKKQFEQHRENGDLDDDEDEDEDPDMGHAVMGAAAASAASEGNGMMPPPTPSRLWWLLTPARATSAAWSASCPSTTLRTRGGASVQGRTVQGRLGAFSTVRCPSKGCTRR